MSKMVKIFTSIILGLIAIFGISTMSNAYEVGNKVSIPWSTYNSSKNIFCVEHGQSLRGSPSYNVVSKVTITGTESKDYKGNTRDNIENAKFAYILSADNGSNHDGGKVQIAIWSYESKWMNAVGKYHSKYPKGTLKNFITGNNAPSLTDDAKNLIKNAETYAKNLKKQEKTEDKTDTDKIKVKSYTDNNKQYLRIGPFKWNFGGELTEIKAYDQNNKSISNIKFIRYSGTEQKNVEVSDIKSGKNFYISIPADSGVTQITQLKGKSKLEEKSAKITFLESVTKSDQNLIYVQPDTKDIPIELSFNYNINLLGNLKVIKVDKENNEIKLKDVEFKIKNKDIGKYVKQSGDTISYVSESNATIFKTDKNGEITIKNLVIGTYVAYETKNPNYGYEIVNNGAEKKVTIDKTAELKITNERTKIKLSGYVWVDRISEKQSVRNYLCKDGEYDSSDILLDGIKVRLKDNTGATIKEATTSNGGAYQFNDVLVKDLEKYYIEFEYDGLTYQNVDAILNKENGSKSSENVNDRNNFNNGFASIEGKTSNTGITRDTNGNEKNQLSYSIDSHKAILNKGNYPINATTKETGFSIKDQYKPGMTEIKNINLGLYEREMPDIRLEKDVENVELSINGYNHVYEYGSKKLDSYEIDKQKTEQGFNVGVKFASEYTGTYKRAIYEPDYNYTKNNADKDNRLNVYITYRIAIYNESTNLKAKVNSILDYYDKAFTIEKIGTGINKEDGQITGDIQTPQPNDYNGYNRVVIQSNTEVEAEKTSSIYVRFKLSDQEVLNEFNNKDGIMTYKNIAEVNSYSVFDGNGNVYAGIDKDSNPGNAEAGNEITYEDDTNQAPGIQLEVQGDRTLSGSVFFDESTGGEAQVRLGDGIYDTSKEHGIEGVQVKLIESKEGGQTYGPVSTDSNGNFTINGFIPGKYTLIYTWGDETYTVQNYKGTIWTENNRNEKEQNGSSWYKINIDTRYSDALDNYNTRQKIDNGEDITTMDSTTPEMSLDLEVNSVYSVVADVDRFEPEGYNVKNIDFGIVERARQSISLEKKVKTFKVTLANGQIIADATIDENGRLSGESNHVTYMGPSDNTNPRNGFVKLELDNELIQGATVEVTYEIRAVNHSEVDYITQEYYQYGIEGKETEKVTITPLAIVDYLDSNWAFESNNNPNWEIKTLDDNEFKASLDKLVYEDEESTVTDKIILYTSYLSNEVIVPGGSRSVELKVSKLLSNSDEISMDNEVEINEIEKNGGRPVDSTPGNYIPGKGHQEPDDSQAPTIIVTPNTGDNLEFIIPIMVGVVALIILGVGIILIKRKALEK